MENLSKKVMHLEKTITEIQKEIMIIRNSASNTNATNSLNVSKNFSNKNKLSIKTNRDAIFKDNNFFKVSKNYFQLTDKEKYFPSNKKLLKNTHSFNFHKKRLNIYNNIFVNSDNSIKMDDRYETIDRESNNKNIDKNNMMNSGLILNKNKNKEINILKNNKDIKINDKKIKKNFKDNFRNKNNDFLHDYKLNTKLTNKFNNNKNYSNYFTNNISTNGIGYFMSINKPCPKKIKKNFGSLLNLKKNKIKTKYKQDYDFENLINFNNNDKNEVISYLSKNKKTNDFNIEKTQTINSYIPQEEYTYNYSINPNNSYQSSIDENTKENINTTILTYFRNNRREIKEKNNFNNGDEIKAYSQILEIIGNESINNLIFSSNLFDKYGTKGFKAYINKNKYNIQKNNFDDTSKCLNEYKKYILSLDKKDELKRQKKKYKLICHKLIKITNKDIIEKLTEDINEKLRMNSSNKNMLEKVKNILKAY